jgi:hypothetical protein
MVGVECGKQNMKDYNHNARPILNGNLSDN